MEGGGKLSSATIQHLKITRVGARVEGVMQAGHNMFFRRILFILVIIFLSLCDNLLIL